jgi:hypothetical protein
MVTETQPTIVATHGPYEDFGIELVKLVAIIIQRVPAEHAAESSRIWLGIFERLVQRIENLHQRHDQK